MGRTAGTQSSIELILFFNVSDCTIKCYQIFFTVKTFNKTFSVRKYNPSAVVVISTILLAEFLIIIISFTDLHSGQAVVINMLNKLVF